MCFNHTVIVTLFYIVSFNLVSPCEYTLYELLKKVSDSSMILPNLIGELLNAPDFGEILWLSGSHILSPSYCQHRILEVSRVRDKLKVLILNI